MSGGWANGSWFPYKDYFFIENDGTVNVSVNYTANQNAASFIGGTGPSFQLKGVVDEVGSCAGLNISWADIPSSGYKNLCPLLLYAPPTADAISASIKLVVPADVLSGARTATITFSGTKV